MNCMSIFAEISPQWRYFRVITLLLQNWIDKRWLQKDSFSFTGCDIIFLPRLNILYCILSSQGYCFRFNIMRVQNNDRGCGKMSQNGIFKDTLCFPDWRGDLIVSHILRDADVRACLSYATDGFWQQKKIRRWLRNDRSLYLGVMCYNAVYRFPKRSFCPVIWKRRRAGPHCIQIWLLKPEGQLNWDRERCVSPPASH